MIAKSDCSGSTRMDVAPGSSISKPIARLQFVADGVKSTLGKVLLAGTAMAATAWWGEQWLGALAPGPSLIAQAVRLGGAIAAAVAVLGLCAQLLAIREFEDVRDAVLKRLRRMRGGA